MRKISFILFSSILLVLNITATALAAVTVNVNPLAPEYYFTSFPQTINITGTASNPDEVAAEVQLYIDGFPVGESVPVPAQKEDVSFSLPWTINEPGTYDVKVTLTKKNPNLEYDNASYVQNDILISQQVTATYPAAPAVAAKILKDSSIKANYGRNGNYISDVAQYMGQGATFPTFDEGGNIIKYVSKSDVFNYENAVRAYLQSCGLTLK